MTPFSFPTIVDCGLFDSRSKFGEGLMLTEDRPVDCFELELFAEDGGCTTYLNGQEYTLRSGQFLCTKPGDVRHSRLPLPLLLSAFGGNGGGASKHAGDTACGAGGRQSVPVYGAVS